MDGLTFDGMVGNSDLKEPLAKLVSGDRLPYFGPFPRWNFGPWNHHAPHSIPKMDSKRDCRSSTQSFARGSKVYYYINIDIRQGF